MKTKGKKKEIEGERKYKPNETKSKI